MDDDQKRIAARVRTWRTDARLTLRQLGDQSDVSASTIHKIENRNESFALARGDSLHFDPSLPHRWLAANGKPARVIVTAILPERIHADLAIRIARATADHMDPSALDARA